MNQSLPEWELEHCQRHAVHDGVPPRSFTRSDGGEIPLHEPVVAHGPELGKLSLPDPDAGAGTRMLGVAGGTFAIEIDQLPGLAPARELVSLADQGPLFVFEDVTEIRADECLQGRARLNLVAGCRANQTQKIRRTHLCRQSRGIALDSGRGRNWRF